MISTTTRAADDTRGWWHRKFAPQVRTVTVTERAVLRRSSVLLAVVGTVVFATMLVGVLTHSGVQRFDAPVDRWFDTQRDTDRTNAMVVLATVFGPVGMPIVVLAVTVSWALLARHAWRPLVLACGMVLGVVTAQALAPLVRHPRPPVAEMLLGPDHSFSFPSGHVLGASDFFLIGAFLVASRTQRRWVTVALFALAGLMIASQVVSRLYLGYHWLTDTLSSVGLSMMITAVVIAIDTHLTTRLAADGRDDAGRTARHGDHVG